MAIRIGSNIPALQAQRALETSANRLGKTFEALSSGMRINSASDDAAGLSVASSLTAASRIYGQAVRNINDAVSAINVADGALAELSNVIIRLKELAEQSANGVYSSRQRQALDNEAQALVQEYDRIRITTSFNGRNLLDGSFSNVGIQISATGNSAEQINVSVGPIRGTVGDGTFGANVCFMAMPWAQIAPVDIASGDINNDGFNDLVIGGWNNGGACVLLGNGDGSFRSPISHVSPFQSDYVNLVDLNGDNKLDLVFSMMRVSLGNGDGTFLANSSYGDSKIGRVGDFDGDGKYDILGYNLTTQNLMFHKGLGDGTFLPGITYAGTAAMIPFGIGDFNGDGNLDAIIDSNIGTPRISLGNGNGSFKAFQDAGVRMTTLAVVDINGDGNTDFVGPDWTTTDLRIVISNGDGTFRAGSSYATASTITSITSGDLNGDGRMDLVAGWSNGSEGSNLIYLGNGNGTFKAASTYTSNNLPTYVFLDDFNADGIKDSITVSSSVTTMAVNLGNVDMTGRFSVSLLSQSGARSSLETLSDMLDNITSARGSLGAQQSRLESALRSALINRQGYDEAASRIMDADVGAESAELVRTNILLKAGAAVLAQANTQPALALNLLKGIQI